MLTSCRADALTGVKKPRPGTDLASSRDNFLRRRTPAVPVALEAMQFLLRL